MLALQSLGSQTKQQLVHVEVKGESHECLFLSSQTSSGLSQDCDKSPKQQQETKLSFTYMSATGL